MLLQLLTTLLIVLSFFNTSFAAEPTTPQKNGTVQITHYCTKNGSPELICLRKVLNQYFQYGSEPNSGYAFFKVYNTSKEELIKTVKPQTFTITVDTQEVMAEKSRIAEYRKSTVATAK